MNSIRALMLLGLLALAPQAVANSAIPEQAPADALGKGDPVKGKQYFAVCQTCHGEGGHGNPELHAPQIAGQAEWYLLRQVTNFRAGVRGAHPQDTFGAQMRAMSLTLPDEQAVRDVVAYVRTFPEHRGERTIEGDLENGERVFLQCAVCHGSRAEGQQLFGAPRLNGMSDWYLVSQLAKLKAGIRGHHRDDDRGLQMSSVTRLFADERAMNDVIAYIQTLP